MSPYSFVYVAPFSTLMPGLSNLGSYSYSPNLNQHDTFSLFGVTFTYRSLFMFPGWGRVAFVIARFGYFVSTYTLADFISPRFLYLSFGWYLIHLFSSSSLRFSSV